MTSAGDPEDTEDFAALLSEYEAQHPTGKKQRRDPPVGTEVRGRVVSIGNDAVFVDLGTKSEGVLDLAEARDASGKLTIHVGDEVVARVIEVDGKAGGILLRRSFAGRGPEAQAELVQAWEHGIPVEGVVTAVNKGGVEVEIAKTRGFCPVSQLDLRHVEDPARFVGERLTFRITRYEAAGPKINLVVSRRAVLEEQAQAAAVETRKKLAVGEALHGTVTSLRDFGAFVDLGGLEGLIHISELGFQRVAHPKDVLSVGQAVVVQVLKMEATKDPKRPEKIALSLKSLENDPWSDATSRFPEGTRCQGKVSRVEAFGAFVEVAPGIEGLVHISELGAGRPVRHAREVAKPGQLVWVKVLAVDRERRRLSLTLSSQAQADEDAEGETYPDKTSAAPTFGTLGDLFKNKRPK